MTQTVFLFYNNSINFTACWLSMNLIKKIALLFLLNLLSNIVFTQELLFNIQFFNQDDGLSDRSTFSINQDDRGLIWVGTGNGLNQFDGQKFKLIGSQNSRTASGNIFRIEKDFLGNFWIQKGGESVIYFDPEKKEILPLKIPEQWGELKFLHHLRQDKNIWLKNTNGQIFYLNSTKEIQPFDGYKLKEDEKVYTTSWRTILVGNSLRFSTFELNEAGDTLRQFPEPTFKFRMFFDTLERQLSVSANGLDLDQDQKLGELIQGLAPQGAPHKLNFTKDGKELLVRDIEKKGMISIRLIQDHNNDYWMIAGYKVWFFDAKGRLQKDLTEEFKKIAILNWTSNDIFIDDHNRLWVATGLGLFLVEKKENPFQLYLNESGKTSARGILMLDEEAVFIANYLGTKIVDKQTGAIRKGFNKTSLGITVINEKEIWGGIHNPAIIKYDLEKDTAYRINIPELRSHQMIIPFFDTSANVVYLGTTDGLWLTDTTLSNVRKYNSLNDTCDLRNQSVNSFYKSKEGLWIATKNGLYLLDSEQTICAHVDFPHNGIKFIHEDQAGDFWLATQGGGLIHWDRTKDIKQQYTTRNGLSHNVIYAVYEDEDEYLWLPSNNGLMRFEKETGNIVVFQAEDGIAHKEFNTYSHYQAKDGRLYLGGLNGVTAFYPKELKSKNNDAPFIVTQLQQFDAEQGKIVNKTRDFQREKKITLAPDDKFFVIDFSLLDYAGQGHLYAWRIKGLEEEWNYQTESSIRINGLQYGDFTLEIKGRGVGGQWAEQELSIPIHVGKPFYLESSFIFLAILGLGLIIFSYFRLRFLRLRNVQRKLKQQVAERTAELSQKNKELEMSNQTKDKLFAIIAHDLRGPAFSLQDVGKKLNYLIKTEQQERLKDFGKNVDQSVSSLTSLLNNLLNWANQNLKATTLNSKEMLLSLLVTKSINEVQALADKKQIQVVVDIPQHLKTFSDEQAVLTILRNLLTNAIKFTPTNGQIKLRAEQKGTVIFLLVVDNGVGINPDRLPHIFDLQKNKSTEGTQGEKGTGLGLSVSKDLAVLNGGDLKVSSIPTKGTTFSILLPFFEG